MDLIERIACLERAELFTYVQAECLARAATAAEEESAPSGRTLYGAGQPANFLYVLCQGAVRLDVGGRQFRLAPGEVFGFEEVLAEGERQHSARTEADCVLLKLDAGEARRLLAEDPGLARGAIRALMVRQLRPQEGPG